MVTYIISVTMPKRVKLYHGGILKLPADIRRRAKLKEGDELIIFVDRGRVILVPRGLLDPVEEYSSILGDVEEDKVFENGLKDLRRKLMGSPVR